MLDEPISIQFERGERERERDPVAEEKKKLDTTPETEQSRGEQTKEDRRKPKLYWQRSEERKREKEREREGQREGERERGERRENEKIFIRASGSVTTRDSA